MSKENKCKARLKCALCKQQHPTCLHREQQPEKSDEVQASKSASEQLPVPKSEPASAKCTRVCGVEGQESRQDQSLRDDPLQELTDSQARGGHVLGTLEAYCKLTDAIPERLRS